MARQSGLPDLSGYARTSDIPDLLGNYRTKTNNPTATMDDMFTDVFKQTFVSNNIMTVAALMSNFPANAARLGLYARVSDLYGSVDDIMRCRYDGTAYRWVPQRPNFTGVNIATGGTINITPLVTPPTLRMTATTLLSNMSFVPSQTNAFVGMQQKIIHEGLLGAFSSTITGLVGSNIVLLGNTTKVIEYGPTGWFSAS